MRGRLKGTLDSVKRTVLTLYLVSAVLLFLPSQFIDFPPSVIADPGWLPGWDRRVEIIIDSGDVDNDLLSFPILIYLSNGSGSGSGIYGEDVSFIFDEVGSNSKRIAIAVDDVEVYVEIECWSAAAEEAWLWANVTANATVNSSLYLYYDNSHADNTAYVGVTGSTPASNVWDANFVGVWHMNNASGGIRDSTKAFNGTEFGDPTYSQPGMAGSPAIDLDGAGDYFDVGGDGAALDITGAITLEAIHKPDSFADYQYIVAKGDTQYILRLQTVVGATVRIEFLTHDGAWHNCYGQGVYPTGHWYYTTGRMTAAGAMEVFTNATSLDTEPGGITTNAIDVAIGEDMQSGGRDYDGDIDEVRISNTNRSNAWIKASFQSAIDDLLDFGGEEATGNSVVLNSPTGTEVQWTVGFECTVIYYDKPDNVTIKIFNSTDNSQVGSDIVNNTVTNNTQVMYGSYTFSVEQTYKWMATYYNTSGDSWYSSTNFSFVVDVPPMYRSVGSNASWVVPEGFIELYAQGYDGIGLDWAWLSTNESGVWRNYTGLDDDFDFWKSVVDNATYAWNGLIELRDDGNSVAGNLTCRFDKTLPGDLTDYLYYDLLPQSLFMYQITGNLTYLDYARSVAGDVETYMLNSTTGLVGWYKNSTSSIDNDVASWSVGNGFHGVGFVDVVAVLASLDSSYIGLMNATADGLLDYYVSSNMGLIYDEVSPNGTVISNIHHYAAARSFESAMMRVYEVNGNQTYLDAAYNSLAGTWELRNLTTNLWPDKANADTNATIDDCQRQYSCGGYIRSCLNYYYLTGNDTIRWIVGNYTDGVYEHIWYGVGNYWQYRTYTDGTPNGLWRAETNFGSVDYAMILMYELTGNSSYRDRAWVNFNTSFYVTKNLMVNDIMVHATSTMNEDLFQGGFAILLQEAMYFYKHSGDVGILAALNTFYDTFTDAHKRNTYGYHQRINPVTHADASNWRSFRGAYGIGAWIYYTIQPSSTVNVTWMQIGNTNLSQLFYATSLRPFMWFDGDCVSFDYAGESINLSGVTGAGTIKFGANIGSVRRDGVLYTAFSGSTLTTTIGTHRYDISFVVPHLPIDMGDVADAWTWSNFTWSSSSVPIGTTVGWKICYNDTFGNVNCTDVRIFDVLASNIAFTWVPPTPANNSIVGQDWVYLNTTITPSTGDDTSAFYDWNYSLVGYWSFECTNATGVYDNSTYSNFGTFQGVAFGQPNLTTGVYGQALEFDGVDDVVNCGAGASLNITNAITIEAWVRAKGSATGVTPGIVCKRGGGFGLIWMDQAENWVSARIYQSDSVAINTDPFAMSQNVWHHIVLTASNVDNKVRIYLDGVPQGAAKDYDGTIQTGVGIFYVGQQLGQTFNGTIDEARAHSRAFSPGEVNASYNNGLYRLERNFAGLSCGNTFGYEAWAIDESGNMNSSGWRWFDCVPTVVNSPANMTCPEGSAGNVIPWMVTSVNDLTHYYTVYMNTAYWSSGNWTNATLINVNVDGLPVGTLYNFTIDAMDSVGNVTDTVFVNVTAVQPSVNHPPDFSYMWGDLAPPTIDWVVTDPGSGQGNYTVERNGTDEGGPWVWTNNTNIGYGVGGLPAGVWNFTGYFWDGNCTTNTTDVVFVTVNPASPVVHLYINDTEAGRSFNLNEIMNLTGVVAPGTLNVTVEFANGTIISGPSLGVNMTYINTTTWGQGTYRVRAHGHASGNYTDGYSVTLEIVVWAVAYETWNIVSWDGPVVIRISPIILTVSITMFICLMGHWRDSATAFLLGSVLWAIDGSFCITDSVATVATLPFMMFILAALYMGFAGKCLLGRRDQQLAGF